MIPEKIINKIESELKGKPSEFSLIGRGSNYDVYKFNANDTCYVLRYQQRATYDFSPVESKLLTQLNGEFAPELFIYDDGTLTGSPFMVQSFIDGEHIKDLNVDQIKIVKNTIDRVHNKTKRTISPRPIKDFFFKYFSEKFCNGIIPDIPVDRDIKDQVYKLAGNYLEGFDNLPAILVDSECLIHGDLNHNNLLWKDNTVNFIDWELARYSIPLFEFATLMYAHAQSKELYPEILDLFKDEEKEIVKTGFYLKLLDSLSWRLRYINQITLSKDAYDQETWYLSHDLEKIYYPD